MGVADAGFGFTFKLTLERGCCAHGTGEVKAGLDPFCQGFALVVVGKQLGVNMLLDLGKATRLWVRQDPEICVYGPGHPMIVLREPLRRWCC